MKTGCSRGSRYVKTLYRTPDRTSDKGLTKPPYPRPWKDSYQNACTSGGYMKSALTLPLLLTGALVSGTALAQQIAIDGS